MNKLIGWIRVNLYTDLTVKDKIYEEDKEPEGHGIIALVICFVILSALLFVANHYEEGSLLGTVKAVFFMFLLYASVMSVWFHDMKSRYPEKKFWQILTNKDVHYLVTEEFGKSNKRVVSLQKYNEVQIGESIRVFSLSHCLLKIMKNDTNYLNWFMVTVLMIVPLFLGFYALPIFFIMFMYSLSVMTEKVFWTVFFRIMCPCLFLIWYSPQILMIENLWLTVITLPILFGMMLIGVKDLIKQPSN